MLVPLYGLTLKFTSVLSAPLYLLSSLWLENSSRSSCNPTVTGLRQLPPTSMASETPKLQNPFDLLMLAVVARRQRESWETREAFHRLEVIAVGILPRIYLLQLLWDKIWRVIMRARTSSGARRILISSFVKCLYYYAQPLITWITTWYTIIGERFRARPTATISYVGGIILHFQVRAGRIY